MAYLFNNAINITVVSLNLNSMERKPELEPFWFQLRLPLFRFCLRQIRPVKPGINAVLGHQVEDMLAEELLAGNISAGDTVTAGCRKDKITFTKE